MCPITLTNIIHEYNLNASCCFIDDIIVWHFKKQCNESYWFNTGQIQPRHFVLLSNNASIHLILGLLGQILVNKDILGHRHALTFVELVICVDLPMFVNCFHAVRSCSSDLKWQLWQCSQRTKSCNFLFFHNVDLLHDTVRSYCRSW